MVRSSRPSPGTWSLVLGTWIFASPTFAPAHAQEEPEAPPAGTAAEPPVEEVPAAGRVELEEPGPERPPGEKPRAERPGAETLEGAPAEGAMAPPFGVPSDLPAERGNGVGFWLGKEFRIGFDGYVRTEFTTIQPDRLFFFKMPADAQSSNNPFAGRSDGFVLADARLNLNASYGNLLVRLGFDGAAATYDDRPEAFDTTGRLSVGLKDAYFQYRFHRAAELSVGRFKPPYDMENLLPTSAQLFVHRALESRGIERHEGFFLDERGMQPGRQLGIMVASPDVLDTSLFEAGYALAVTNGNPDAAFNDNDLPAIYARVQGGVKFGVPGPSTGDAPPLEGPATYTLREGVFLGFSVMYNELTSNPPPNRQDDRVWGVGADLSGRWWLFIVQGQILFQQTERLGFVTAAQEAAVGGHIQASVAILDTGLTPGYRFAVYDPRMPQAGVVSPGPDDDLVMHHTIGLRWVVPGLPLATYLEYTRSVEQGGRAFNNDRIEMAAQVTFE